MQEFLLPYIARSEKITFLAGLLEHPWAMLFDSGGTDNNFNRFDIFSFEPSVKASYDGHTVALETNLELPSLDLTNPLDCLRKILNHLKPKLTKEVSDLPFNGGWLGYISYDFGRHLEKLPTKATDDIQLSQVQMGLYQWALISDHKNKTTNLYNFGLDNSSWLHIVDQFKSLKNELIKTNKFKLTSPWLSNTTKNDYLKAFNKIQDYIHAGDCYQVNFAQRFTARFSGSTLQAYQKLSLANQAPFSAYLNFEEHQILSLSPERFIECHQGKVKTQPIKGTRPRSLDPKEDEKQKQALVNSDKDRAENLMIVDLLRNDLSRTAAKASVKVTELFGHYRFASVHHLISTIESELTPQYDNFDLLATTLPGGSITGAPKIRAMQIIEELEPVRRNLYCGIIGYIDFAGNMDTNICIRTLIAKDNKLHCWAGGGLVADSNGEEEYQETFDKLSKILPVLECN